MLSLWICLKFSNSGSIFFKSQQQLFSIFYVAFYSVFGSFANFNCNSLLIFIDGSRYGSVTWNMDYNQFTYLKRFILLFGPSTTSNHRGCLSDNWKLSSLPLLVLDWRTFSRRVTPRWWRQWAKNQVPTNQNSRNRWCLFVRRTICILEPTWASRANICLIKQILDCWLKTSNCRP